MGRSLLLVDDEINILTSLNRIFRKEKYKIFLATSGQEALDILDKNPVQVIISDFKMPHMNGADLLKEVRKRHPRIVRLMLSGYANFDVIEEIVNDKTVYKFISKPWMQDTLVTFVAEAFKIYENSEEDLQSEKISS